MRQKKSQSIKNKMLYKTAILFCAAMLAVTLLFCLVSGMFSLSESRNSLRDSLQSIGSYLDTYFDEVDAIARDVNYSYYLQNYLSAAILEEDKYTEPYSIKNMKEYEMSSQAFSSTLLERPDVTSIMVFGKKKLLFYRSLYEYRNRIIDYSQEDWYQKAVEFPQNCIVTGPVNLEFFEGSDTTICVSREIQSCEDGSFLGVILINLNLNRIAGICEIYHSDPNGFLCLTNDQGELVYQQKKGIQALDLSGEDSEELLLKMEVTDENRFTVVLNGTRYLLVSQQMEDTGWTLYYLEPFEDALADIFTNGVWMILALLIALVITLLILNRILSDVLKPLGTLQQQMEQVNLDDLNRRMPVESDDEIGKLSANFNGMLERMDNLKGQLIREQEDKRRYELQALQSQINPHFLYNTLDSIIWMAETGDSHIVAMTEALARLFRISLNKGNEEILFGKELEHVKNYLIIQKMRYADKFTYEIQADPETEKCRVIKLILQPVVENCIYHGIKLKRGTGKIVIRSFFRDSRLIVQIEDDGVGMPEEMCERILSESVKTDRVSGSGIGVRNVNERIRLRFGPDYGLHYTSRPGEGTLVEYVLPVQGGDEF